MADKQARKRAGARMVPVSMFDSPEQEYRTMFRFEKADFPTLIRIHDICEVEMSLVSLCWRALLLGGAQRRQLMYER